MRIERNIALDAAPENQARRCKFHGVEGERLRSVHSRQVEQVGATAGYLTTSHSLRMERFMNT